MLRALPYHNPPGSLREDQIRALWRLRTSLLRLKPEVDPDRDYAGFREFVAAAHVHRVVDGRGRARAMACHKRFDGTFAGRRYRLAALEYGFVDPSVSKHPAVTFNYSRMLISWRRPLPRVANYIVGVGYPRSAVMLARAVPDLRIDGDPSLDALERHLLERAIEIFGPSKFNRARRLFELPTIPDPISPAWRARNGDNPVLRAYEAALPDWQRGRALLLIARLDGSGYAAVREIGRRVLARR